MNEILIEVSKKLHHNKLLLVSAESCTGGWVAKSITDLAGSSVIFDRGFVTYSNQAKQDMLNVSKKTLERFGAVSEQVVKEMVEGALKNSRADIAVSISGVAGPDGGTPEKPLGMVCFGWMKRDNQAVIETVMLDGDRDAVRFQSVVIALQGIGKMIESRHIS